MADAATSGRTIVLIGLMGSGKTTVGRVLAERLGRPFLDTDEAVEEAAGCSIAALFADGGEEGFRAAERAAIRRVSVLRGHVIAVGGGAVLDPANVTLLRRGGDIVWLDAPVDALTARLEDPAEHDRRPLLGEDGRGATLERLRTERHRAYEQAAATRIDTVTMTPPEVTEAILAWARTRPGLLSTEDHP